MTLADHSAQVVNLVKPKEEKAKPATSFRIKDAFSETSPSIVSMPEMHEEEKKIQCTGNDPFDLSQLEAALSEYVAKNTPEKIISIALKARKPDISGHNITIKVDNLLQKDKLEACKAALQNFLIESLNNGQINCLIELYERQAGEIAEKNLITAQSKLDYFIELNPVIDEMRRMFGLEIG
ncbi:hypothetical protein LJC12_00515 [Odoribacter sp. OttesenSCG-928-J03]|nr:hypothetical protein [Odoribacter sp. OttesenSCG-928-J03]MDL2283373.1 hypothetical protein [Odoribacter sp. OttesenSCG-928-G04]